MWVKLALIDLTYARFTVSNLLTLNYYGCIFSLMRWFFGLGWFWGGGMSTLTAQIIKFLKARLLSIDNIIIICLNVKEYPYTTFVTSTLLHLRSYYIYDYL